MKYTAEELEFWKMIYCASVAGRGGYGLKTEIAAAQAGGGVEELRKLKAAQEKEMRDMQEMVDKRFHESRNK